MTQRAAAPTALACVAAFAIAALTPASSASADAHAAGEPESAASGVSSWFEADEALEAWDDRDRWRYNTEYLAPLTRGVAESRAPLWVRRGSMLFTLPFDILHAPIGAISGLFGR